VSAFSTLKAPSHGAKTYYDNFVTRSTYATLKHTGPNCDPYSSAGQCSWLFL